MKKLLPLLTLLAACEEGPSPDTLIEDVQVVAAVADPPSVALGEPWTLTAHVADPKARGARVLVWSCIDDVCETALADLDDERAVIDVPAATPVPLWVMACDPEICDLDNPALDDLIDPIGWMERLPLRGVSLATRQVNLAEPDAPPTVNPVVDSTPPIARISAVERGDSRTLRFGVPGAVTAWGYSTAGGFSRPSEDLDSDGEVALTWFAPGQRDTPRLYVVFEDEQGGTTVWRDDAEVR